MALSLRSGRLVGGLAFVYMILFFTMYIGRYVWKEENTQMTMKGAEGYFVVQRYSDQLTAGVTNILALQCLASKIGGVAVVEPSVNNSRYGIDVHVKQHLRFGDLYDIRKWNHFTTSLHYNPLVSVEYFNETVHAYKSKDLILVEYNCEIGSKKVLEDGLAFCELFGLKLVKHVCFDFMKTVKFSDFKEYLYSEYQPTEVVVLFHKYGGIGEVEPGKARKSYRTYMSGTNCFFHTEYVFNGLFPSPSIMSDAAKYVDKYMNDSPKYLSVMVRIERSLRNMKWETHEKSGEGAMKCVQNVILRWKKAQKHYGIHSTFLTIDVGTYGSDSFQPGIEKSALIEAAEHLFSVIYSGSMSLRQWEQSFATIAMERSNSSGYIAMVQQVISAKGSVLVTAGGKSTYHWSAQRLHKHFHHHPQLVPLGEDCS